MTTTLDTSKLAKAAPGSARDRMISAVFETQDKVQAAVRRLIDRGIPAEDISVMGRNFESTTRVTGFVTKQDVILGGLKQGAIFGSLFGSVLSLLTGVGVLFIPFVGPIVAAGPISAVLLGATSGALVAGAGAGLGSLLMTLGMPEDKAAIYQTLVSAGEFLLMAEVPEARSGEYKLLIESAGGKEVHTTEQVLPRSSVEQYDRVEDLTPDVRSHLSPEAQQLFMTEYNASVKSDEDSAKAEHKAWDAVREKFSENEEGVWS
jgi:cation transport regulator ChaB